jgi:hypothetical protein
MPSPLAPSEHQDIAPKAVAASKMLPEIAPKLGTLLQGSAADRLPSGPLGRLAWPPSEPISKRRNFRASYLNRGGRVTTGAAGSTGYVVRKGLALRWSNANAAKEV